MPAEGAGRGEFTEFVADHVFRHINRYMATTIMHLDPKQLTLQLSGSEVLLVTAARLHQHEDEAKFDEGVSRLLKVLRRTPQKLAQPPG